MSFVVTKTEITLGFEKDKPTRYKLAQQTIPPVTFNQLVADVADSCGVNTTMSKAVVEGMINRMCYLMGLGHAVQMGEFGTFKPVFSVKTQQTREAVSVDNVKTKKIRFYPGKRFKNVLEDMKFVSMSGNIGSSSDPGKDDPSQDGGGSDFE